MRKGGPDKPGQSGVRAAWDLPEGKMASSGRRTSRNSVLHPVPALIITPSTKLGDRFRRESTKSKKLETHHREKLKRARNSGQLQLSAASEP